MAMVDETFDIAEISTDYSSESSSDHETDVEECDSSDDRPTTSTMASANYGKKSDIPELKRSARYAQKQFTEELAIELADIQEPEPVPVAKKKPDSDEFHAMRPFHLEKRLNCVRCYRLKKVEMKTSVKCSVCDKALCFVKERNCLDLEHNSS